jgi:putative transposase
MIYAVTREELETRRKAFIRKSRIKRRAVADGLEEAGDRLFNFTRLPPSQWRCVRTTNAIERLHEEFKRRIKTQTVLPSGRHRRRVVLGAACFRPDQHAQEPAPAKAGVDDWQNLATKPIDQPNWRRFVRRIPTVRGRNENKAGRG